MSRHLCWTLFGSLAVAGAFFAATQPTVASLAEDKNGKQQANEKDGGERAEEENHDFERERAELEMRSSQLEVVTRMARISESQTGTASFALMHFEGLFENEADAAKFLSDTLKHVQNPSIKRLIRIKLAEFYAGMDKRDQAREQFRHLLTER